MSDIEAQHQHAAQVQAYAKAGAAEHVIQPAVPGIAQIGKEGAANGVKGQAAKGKVDDKAVDEGKAQFVADQRQFGAPQSPESITAQIPTAAHEKGRCFPAVVDLRPQPYGMGHARAQPKVAAVVKEHADEIDVRVHHVEGVAQGDVEALAVYRTGRTPQRVVVNKGDEIGHQHGLAAIAGVVPFLVGVADVHTGFGAGEFGQRVADGAKAADTPFPEPVIVQVIKSTGEMIGAEGGVGTARQVGA